MRIWYQSFVDPAESKPYFERLRGYLVEIADPGTEVDVFGITPPDRYFHRLTELRCGGQAVAHALRAADEGYDAFVLGHFQDPGLYEARASVEIPVVGMGETAIHTAAQLGRLMALVSIDSGFTAMHWEQAERYGLRDRVLGVIGMEAAVADFMPAFGGDSAAYARMLAAFRKQVEPLVERGAEVIVPAGGLFGLVTAAERDFRVGHAVVLNPVALAFKTGELWAKLRSLHGFGPSRGPSFALPPAEAVAEFRALYE